MKGKPGLDEELFPSSPEGEEEEGEEVSSEVIDRQAGGNEAKCPPVSPAGKFPPGAIQDDRNSPPATHKGNPEDGATAEKPQPEVESHTGSGAEGGTHKGAPRDEDLDAVLGGEEEEEGEKYVVLSVLSHISSFSTSTYTLP